MALALSITIAGPIPPPHKADAAQSQIKSLAVKPPVSTKPQALTQPETPPPATTATVATPVAPPVTQPVYTPPAPQYGCGSDPNMAYIYQHESGCSTTAVNASSGAYGLCQALPGYKMASAGADWQSSWDTQNAWCVSYAIQRYGSTYNAYLFWVSNHWW